MASVSLTHVSIRIVGTCNERMRRRMSYFVQHFAGLTQASEPLFQQRYFFVCTRPEDLLQCVQVAGFFILPEM
jgi:hypothetical protein